MPRRSTLTERQRSAIFDLPTDKTLMLRHYTLADDDVLPYAVRRQTRQQHLRAMRQIYGFKMFSGQGARILKAWLEN